MRAPWLFTLALLASCERKAPGPEECLAFAHRAVGVTRAADLDVPLVRRRVDDLTRTCLVTPYDRGVIRCVELGASASYCQREFAIRARRSRSMRR